MGKLRASVQGAWIALLSFSGGCYTILDHPDRAPMDHGAGLPTTSDLGDADCGTCHADPELSAFRGLVTYVPDPWGDYYADPWWCDPPVGPAPVPHDPESRPPAATGSENAWQRDPWAYRNPVSGSGPRRGDAASPPADPTPLDPPAGDDPPPPPPPPPPTDDTTRKPEPPREETRRAWRR